LTYWTGESGDIRLTETIFFQIFPESFRLAVTADKADMPDGSVGKQNFAKLIVQLMTMRHDEGRSKVIQLGGFGQQINALFNPQVIGSWHERTLFRSLVENTEPDRQLGNDGAQCTADMTCSKKRNFWPILFDEE
jgi:hypothetical protein